MSCRVRLPTDHLREAVLGESNRSTDDSDSLGGGGHKKPLCQVEHSCYWRLQLLDALLGCLNFGDHSRKFRWPSACAQ